ncbi:unnamed protein product [Prorocentrum cordatum]|uniref:beta-galactoside alpha-(2,6)-sialyltransferase n=1 Tax=Prorocentrum cordatum TaxID=2364126 RepID=A0ABN9V312_9DINO|nr:unnamed protein product [Polarella glacialis]
MASSPTWEVVSSEVLSAAALAALAQRPHHSLSESTEELVRWLQPWVLHLASLAGLWASPPPPAASPRPRLPRETHPGLTARRWHRHQPSGPGESSRPSALRRPLASQWWKADAKVQNNDGGVENHLMCYQMLESMAAFDQLNLPDIAGAEIMSRAIQLSEERCRLPLLNVCWSARWHPAVLATDASTFGLGACTRQANPHDVGAIGRISEKWRFKVEQCIDARNHALLDPPRASPAHADRPLSTSHDGSDGSVGGGGYHLPLTDCLDGDGDDHPNSLPTCGLDGSAGNRSTHDGDRVGVGQGADSGVHDRSTARLQTTFDFCQLPLQHQMPRAHRREATSRQQRVNGEAGRLKRGRSIRARAAATMVASATAFPWVSVLEKIAVGPGAVALYSRTLRQFLVHCQALQLTWGSMAELDIIVVDYLNATCTEGHGADEASRLIAALGYVSPELYKKTRASLPRATGCAVSWNRRTPAQSRLPLPRLAALAIAGGMIMLGIPRMAIVVAVSHARYLRPIEAMALVGKSIVAAVPAAGSGYTMMGLVLHETSLGAPGKTGAFDEAVAIDDRWLWEPLLGLKASSRPDSAQWNFDGELCREVFSAVAEGLGLGPFDPHPYQPRLGGASEDLATQRRTPEQVIRRGRWATAASLKRYGMETKLLRVINQISPSVFSFESEVLHHFSQGLRTGVGPRRGQLPVPVLLGSGVRREVSKFTERDAQSAERAAVAAERAAEVAFMRERGEGPALRPARPRGRWRLRGSAAAAGSGGEGAAFVPSSTIAARSNPSAARSMRTPDREWHAASPLAACAAKRAPRAASAAARAPVESLSVPAFGSTPSFASLHLGLASVVEEADAAWRGAARAAREAAARRELGEAAAPAAPLGARAAAPRGPRRGRLSGAAGTGAATGPHTRAEPEGRAGGAAGGATGLFSPKVDTDHERLRYRGWEAGANFGGDRQEAGPELELKVLEAQKEADPQLLLEELCGGITSMYNLKGHGAEGRRMHLVAEVILVRPWPQPGLAEGARPASRMRRLALWSALPAATGAGPSEGWPAVDLEVSFGARTKEVHHAPVSPPPRADRRWDPAPASRASAAAGGASGVASGLSKPQLAIFCHLKQAAGDRFQTDPPLPLAKTCAVVSHSGGLLFHELGRDIDGHERVIRFNGNRVKGFERHVGNRTDVRFGIFPGLEDTEVGDVIVHSVLQPICGQEDCHHKYGRPVRSINGPPVDADPTFGRIMRKMLLALSSCERVDAFEMTPSDVASRCGGYAYDDEDAMYPGQADVNFWHGYFNAEHDLWARLSVDVGLRRKLGKVVLPGFSVVRCEGALPALSSVERDLVAPVCERDPSRCPPPRRLVRGSAGDPGAPRAAAWLLLLILPVLSLGVLPPLWLWRLRPAAAGSPRVGADLAPMLAAPVCQPG